MSTRILQQMRDALETAAGQYGPITDEQRNEWMGYVKEFDEHAFWYRISDSATSGPQAETPQETEE
jgi:hypothetical protein